jgi:chemotaxis protein CheZ
MTSNENPPTTEKPGSKTVVVCSETEHAYAEALEKILIGFGNGDVEQIRSAMNLIGQGPDMLRLQERLGTFVKDFHSTVTNVKSGLDPASITMSSTNIPDAARKLEYVLNATNDATHKLFGIIERQENLISEGDAALEKLKTELQNGVNPIEALARYETDYKRWTGATHQALSEAVMTQEFQDLCGQALKKVLNLVQEMEGNLTALLKHLGIDIHQPKEPVAEKLEQDNVDDLLKQFGF